MDKCNVALGDPPKTKEENGMKAKIAKLVLALVLMGVMVYADASVMAADEIHNTMLSKQEQAYLLQTREKGMAALSTGAATVARTQRFIDNTMIGPELQDYLRQASEKGMAACYAAEAGSQAAAPSGLERILSNLAANTAPAAK